MDCSAKPASAKEKGFQEYVSKTKEMLKKVHLMEEEAEELREKAVDLEYNLMTQALFATPSPTEKQMEDIENLHKKANVLVC